MHVAAAAGERGIQCIPSPLDLLIILHIAMFIIDIVVAS